MQIERRILIKIFLSTPSGWRATLDSERYGASNVDISIHALRVEGDHISVSGAAGCAYFYPRPPGGGRRRRRYNICEYTEISIHALRVEGDKLCDKMGVEKEGISIHALRVEGDLISFADRLGKIDISIHALRVEGDSKNGQSFRLFLRKREKNLPL